MNSWAESACYPRSTFYPLSDGPSIPEPPDHYVLLSHLLDLWVSQLSYLLPLHYQYDVRPYLGNLRTPPLHFGRRPPQSNCLPCTVPDPDDGPRLEPQTHQGGISGRLHRDWRLCFKASHLSLQVCSSQCKATVKVHGSFRLAAAGDCIFTNISTSLSLGLRQCGHRYAIRAGPELTRQGISLP